VDAHAGIDANFLAIRPSVDLYAAALEWKAAGRCECASGAQELGNTGRIAWDEHEPPADHMQYDIRLAERWRGDDRHAQIDDARRAEGHGRGIGYR